MNYKKYFLISLFLFVLQSLQAMDQQLHKKMPAFSTDDTAILPITVNLVDDDVVVYSTHFNANQLQYLGTLHNQHNFSDDNKPLIVPLKQVSQEHFETVEKVVMLLAHCSPKEKKQKQALKKCFETSKEPDHTFVDLLNVANYLGCPLLREVCAEQLYARAKSLYAINADQAVALLKKVKVPELSREIGNHILEHSRFLKQLLITVSNKTKKVPEANIETVTESLCYFPSEARLACGLGNGSIVFFHDNEYICAFAWSSCYPIESIFFSSKNTFHVRPGDTSNVYTCHKDLGRTIRRNANEESNECILHYPRKGNCLYTASNKTIKIWNTDIYEEKLKYIHPKKVKGLVVDPKKNYLYLGCDDCIDIYDVENKRIVQTFPFNFKIRALCLSKDRTTLFIGDNNWNVSLLNLENDTVKTINNGYLTPNGDISLRPLDQLKLSPDGTLLAVARKGVPGFMRLLDTRDGYCVKKFNNGSHHCMDFSPDGSTLAAKGENCILFNKLYDPRLLKRLRKLPAPHIAVLDYCAHAVRNNEQIDLSEQNQELFDQLPTQIKDYFEQIKKK